MAKNPSKKKKAKKKKSKKLSDNFKRYADNALNYNSFETVFEMVIPLKPITKKNSNEIARKREEKDEAGKVIKPAGMRIVSSAAYRKYAKACKPFMPVNLNICRPVNIKAIYYLDSSIYSDLNNYHNALLDVLVDYGVIYDDNHYIVVSTDGSSVRLDRDNPRTEVYIQLRK